MDKLITVRALESFSVYNPDETELLGEVEKGEVLLAYLHEETGEYFAEDRQGRDIYVGELDIHENLNLDSGFKLVQIGMTVEHKKNFLFKAIASMGHGSGHMSLANNCVADIEDVPDEVKARMKQINEQIHGLQEELRMIRDSLHLQEQLRMIRDSLHECCPDCSPDEN
ncbi:hypothetical protein [Brevibacillus laterosporus]|uniref:hypothetical protein n=1 Tax=Brevibacillus laterosporus TaxID=1465 RepID=UPI00215D1407|nr:hypothetical protein [Brevibacillus laterosporus]MCR8994498.1 hypothetical protein [Brevibacillus laterosporus]